MPWHTEEWMEHPWCGDRFTQDNLLWEHSGLLQVGRSWFPGINLGSSRDLQWMACALWFSDCAIP